MSRDNRVTIKMGAAEWSVTIPTNEAPLSFNLREMEKDDRRKFHGTFMEAVRVKLSDKGKRKRKKRRRNHAKTQDQSRRTEQRSS